MIKIIGRIGIFFRSFTQRRRRGLSWNFRKSSKNITERVNQMDKAIIDPILLSMDANWCLSTANKISTNSEDAKE
jgi:hypothetical protein